MYIIACMWEGCVLWFCGSFMSPTLPTLSISKKASHNFWTISYQKGVNSFRHTDVYTRWSTAFFTVAEHNVESNSNCKYISNIWLPIASCQCLAFRVACVLFALRLERWQEPKRKKKAHITFICAFPTNLKKLNANTNARFSGQHSADTGNP